MNPLQERQESDMFRSLRQMRSPLSLNAVKNYILEHLELTLWQKIQRLILQTGAFSVIIGSICFINSPAGETKGIVHRTVDTPLAAGSAIFEKQITNESFHAIALKNNNATQSTADQNANDGKPNQIAQIHSTSIAEPQPLAIDSKTQGLSEIILPKENERSSFRPFAEMQGITIFDHARMYGGGVSAGVIHDWQIVTLHFMDASGSRDDRKDNPSLSNISRIKNETGEQLALMFGGIVEKGRFTTSLQVGPSFTISQVTSGLKGIPASNSVLNQNMFGVSTQISAGYRFSDFLSANIEGLIGYHSAFSKGIMMSIMIQP